MRNHADDPFFQPQGWPDDDQDQGTGAVRGCMVALALTAVACLAIYGAFSLLRTIPALF